MHPILPLLPSIHGKRRECLAESILGFNPQAPSVLRSSRWLRLGRQRQRAEQVHQSLNAGENRQDCRLQVEGIETDRRQELAQHQASSLPSAYALRRSRSCLVGSSECVRCQGSRGWSGWPGPGPQLGHGARPSVWRIWIGIGGGHESTADEARQKQRVE